MKPAHRSTSLNCDSSWNHFPIRSLFPAIMQASSPLIETANQPSLAAKLSKRATENTGSALLSASLIRHHRPPPIEYRAFTTEVAQCYPCKCPFSCTPNPGGQRKRVGVRTVERALVACGKKGFYLKWHGVAHFPIPPLKCTSHLFQAPIEINGLPMHRGTSGACSLRSLLDSDPSPSFSPTMQGTYTHVYPKDRFLIPALKVR